MACKKTPQEWRHAIQVLKQSASKFSGMGDKVFPLLKFSYDNLPNEKVRSCFLYCALFPEDFLISKDDLVYCWMGEEMLDEYANVEEAQNESYHIIGTLTNACLLEDHKQNSIKMHDVVRDMALWIACEGGQTNQSVLVHTGAGLKNAPNSDRWKSLERVSLMTNCIQHLRESPKSPNLLTLFLRDNYLQRIVSDFFDFMPTLRVLDLSENHNLTQLPAGVSNLVSLEHLNLSRTGIIELPMGLKALIRLKYFNLEDARKLQYVPPNVFSCFSMLKVLRMMVPTGSNSAILFQGKKAIVDELQGLKHIDVLTLSVSSTSDFNTFFSYHNLVTSTRKLCLCELKGFRFPHVSTLAKMKHLDTLHISSCHDWEQFEITWAGPRNSMALNRSYLLSVQYVFIHGCSKLKDLTWLIFAPNLLHLRVSECYKLECIIRLEKSGEVENLEKELIPFAKLTTLELSELRILKSIFESALPFPYLNNVDIYGCPALEKLPLDSSSAHGCDIIIRGDNFWWRNLKWEDDDTRNVFATSFRSASYLPFEFVS